MSIWRRKHGHWRLGLAAVLVTALVAIALPARAAPVDGFTLPCQPYWVAGYNFWEFVSGVGYHAGQDIACTGGKPVYAIANGTVAYSGFPGASTRWGNLIMIEHEHPGGGKAQSLYGHLRNDRQVSGGQSVSKGQLIGFVGPSFTTENGNWAHHLHLQTRLGAYDQPYGTYSPAMAHGYEPATEFSRYVNSTDYINNGLPNVGSMAFAVEGGGTLYYNSANQVTFRVRNRGLQKWWPEGNANPVRLGTVGPKDRASPLAGSSGQGWVGATRIKLQNAAALGEEATFVATFPSNQQPGHYPECFVPVMEGVTWITESQPLCVGFDLQPPGWRAEFVNQLVSANSSPTDLSGGGSTTNLNPGQKRNVKLLLRNAGELPWDASGANPTRIATGNPQNRASSFATIGDGAIAASENWLTTNRASTFEGRYDSGSNSVMADSQITTGEVGVFSFTMTMPDAPGVQREYFQPVVDGQRWMPDLGIYFEFSITNPGWHFQYVTQSQTTQTIGTSGNTIDATLQLRNTGRESWPVGGLIRLSTENPRDHASPFYTPSGTGAWLSANRPSSVTRNVTSSGKGTVDPGEVGEFGFRITVPASTPAGQQRLYLQPLIEGVDRFPENPGIYFPFNIVAHPYDFQYVTQTNPATLTAGSPTGTGTLRLKNTGRTTWSSSGQTPLRLGTDHPRDHSNRFAGGAGWIGSTRVVLNGNITDPAKNGPPVTVAPGETAEFAITFNRTTTPAGSYQEYFTPVLDGMAWLTDIGIYFPVVVQ